MADLSSINAATQFEPTPVPNIADIYFNAVSISSDPMGLGSDVDFQVSNQGQNPAIVNAIYLISRDGTGVFVSRSTILEDFDPSPTGDDNWSIEIPIVSGSWNTGGTITFADETALYDNTGSSQTKARIPIIRDNGGDPIPVAVYGTYHEGIRCVNGASVVEFYKI
jgi:hypothetical protein